MLGGGTSGTGGLYGPDGTTGSTTGGDTSRPSYDTFDDDPELSKLPKRKTVAGALKAFGESGREGKAYGSAPSATPTSNTPAATSAPKGAIGRLSDQPGPGETETTPAGHQSGSGLYDFLGSIGQRMRDYSTSHTNGEPPKPPVYLPQQTPPVPVQPQPAPGASPGALQGPMSGGAGYPGGPSLAMQQNPLGARIMSAINPAAGPVA
jgi:hypothetical protein